MYQLNIVDCMLLWMDLLVLRRIDGTTYDDNALAAHNCQPHVVAVSYTIDADNSMVEMHIRRMHLTT